MVESVRTPYDLDNIYLEEVRASLFLNTESCVQSVYNSASADPELSSGLTAHI